jgi:hypothetical protein
LEAEALEQAGGRAERGEESRELGSSLPLTMNAWHLLEAGEAQEGTEAITDEYDRRQSQRKEWGGGACEESPTPPAVQQGDRGTILLAGCNFVDIDKKGLY